MIPAPQGRYVPASRHGDLIFVSEMTPRRDGVLVLTGAVGPAHPPADLEDAVTLAASNALLAAGSRLEPGEGITGVVNLVVYINARPDFREHSKVADAASAYFEKMLGAPGVGARTAVGVSSLPGDAPVEVQITVSVG